MQCSVPPHPFSALYQDLRPGHLCPMVTSFPVNHCAGYLLAPSQAQPIAAPERYLSCPLNAPPGSLPHNQHVTCVDPPALYQGREGGREGQENGSNDGVREGKGRLSLLPKSAPFPTLPSFNGCHQSTHLALKHTTVWPSSFLTYVFAPL